MMPGLDKISGYLFGILLECVYVTSCIQVKELQYWSMNSDLYTHFIGYFLICTNI